ncbi:hypothetical protein [Marinoscillum furvescens]|uniref:Lipid A 3-O-deacylase PagL n=1 Tax=Marinoscillum furvescens DSM 4134 TaxID=1122208 RepID=A0A3D9KZV6_MARFU|nr:hypothetical protein [Marinoscillum furvescens]RED96188.1 hypothetical protein C7460_11579 [Marinoscillum furvescens DSM 4134]
MKRLSLYIFSSWISLIGLAQVADTTQTAPSDSVATLPVEQAPPQLLQPSLLWDYGKSITTAAGFDQKYEGSLTLLFFERYYLIGEAGKASLSPENAIENGSYTSEGEYFRVGGGYMAPINATSRLGIGVNYAISTFEDRGSAWIKSSEGVQDDYQYNFGPRQGEARWIEAAITSESNLRLNKKEPEAKINQLFSIGFQFRMRFMSTYDRYSVIDVYSVPGYGRVVNNPNPALNIYLRFHPF